MDMKLGFEQWATDQGFDLSTIDDLTAYCDHRTFDAWRGYFAAYTDHVAHCSGIQLFAEIKKSSKYAYQAEAAKREGHAYPFQVHIEQDVDGYVVKGGYGGQYRLDDVALFVLGDDDNHIYITK
ncbi:hypothetical protein D3C76_1374790 [compost metagenome]